MRGPDVAQPIADFASTMYASTNVMQSERSRRLAGFEVPIVAGKSTSERRHTRSAWPTVRVPIGSDADIVVARQQGRALAIAMNFSTTDSAFIATTISELARALLSHTVRGEIWLHTVNEDDRSGVVIVARDPVPRDGWRQGQRAVSDLNLPDVCRLVDEFDIASDAGRGTTIRATKWCRKRSLVTGG
jgi:serine/threonine-protein kinase RsbT